MSDPRQTALPTSGVSSGAGDPTTLSVVILSFNRCRQLTTVLERLRGIDCAGRRRQTIVVDNASTDGTREMLAGAGVQTVLLDKNRGVSAWNEGAAVATGEWLLLLDDDCYPADDAVPKALAAAEKNRAAMVSFFVRDPARPSFVFNASYPTGLLSFWGCSVLISRAVFARLGGFEPGIFCWAHEVDFTLRLLDAGHLHAYAPEAVSFHMTRPAYSERKYVMNHRNLAYIAGRLFPATARRKAVWALTLPVLNGFGEKPFSTVHFRVFRALLAGLREGRARARPVRPEVAAAYTRHFHDFSPGMILTPVRRRRDPERIRYFPPIGMAASLQIK
jgi:GT2 family glycosyltransferase